MNVEGYDILKNKDEITEEEDLTVMVLTGDGSAYGMGLSATSGAMDRGLDFLYLFYDNEGYGSTGHQYSPATPHGALTATSRGSMGYPGNKKDLFSIWAAHNPSYVATVVGAPPLDLARKVEKARHMAGPRLIISRAPCPAGWGYEPSETVAIGKLAVSTGIWPLKEYIAGKVTHTKIPKRRPVEEYLRKQERFRHLFVPQLLKRVVPYESQDPLATKRPASGLTLWGEVLAAGAAVSRGELVRRTEALDPHDPVNIQYTSGTTGFPKAVILTHHNILNNAYFSALAMHFTERDRLCVPVPFYHCFGMVLANLLCLSMGACIVIACDHFDPQEVLTAAAEEKCTGIHGVPTMFIAELDHPHFSQFDLTCLRTGIMAGAPCPPALVKRVMEDMHCTEILIGYGETEASPITHLTRRNDTMERRFNTVGKNLPHQEVKVVDVKSGATSPCGKIGEICFRGYHIMKGYYGDPAASAKAIDMEGWLHSGDLGRMDEEGYVQITGRLKEMIIRGSENIYPREIEDYLFAHPKVAVVAVFGVPDEYYGEEIMAWIKPRSGKTLSEEEIRDFCREGLAYYKIPKYIRFVDKFPMTVTGKVQKFRMQEMAKGL